MNSCVIIGNGPSRNLDLASNIRNKIGCHWKYGFEDAVCVTCDWNDTCDEGFPQKDLDDQIYLYSHQEKIISPNPLTKFKGNKFHQIHQHSKCFTGVGAIEYALMKNFTEIYLTGIDFDKGYVNNCQLKSVIRALLHIQMLYSETKFRLYTNSEYLFNTLKENNVRIYRWEENGNTATILRKKWQEKKT